MADRLLFDRDTGSGFRLAVRDADGTVTTIGPAADDHWFGQPNPAASRIAFITSPAGTHDPPPYTTSDLWTCDADGTNDAVLIDSSAQTPAWTFCATPHWAPSGSQIVVARNTAATAVRPTVINATTGAIVADVDFDAGASLTDASFHPSANAGGAGIARLVYCRTGSLYRRDWDGTAPVGARTLIFDATTWETGGPGVTPWLYDPVYSPDGTQVFFLAEFAGQGNGDWGIGAVFADGTSPYRVSPDDHIYSKPELSADGTTCYTHRFNGNWEIVEVPANGTAVATPALVVVLVDNGDYNEFAVPFSPPLDETPDPPPCTLHDDSFSTDGFLAGSFTDGAGTGDPRQWQVTGDIPLEIVAGEVIAPRPGVDTGFGSGNLPVGPADVEIAVTVPDGILGGDAISLFARGVEDYSSIVVIFTAAGVSLTKLGPIGVIGPVGGAYPIVAGDRLALRCVGGWCGALVNDVKIASLTDPEPLPDGLAGFVIQSEAAPAAPTTIDDCTILACVDVLPPDPPPIVGDDDPPKLFAPLSPCGDPPRVVRPSGPLGPLSPCAETRVGVWRRGQRGVYVWLDSTLRQIDSYEWGRARTATTSAKVNVPFAGTVDAACCQLLADVEPWEYELRIFRDMTEVWRGPIVTVRETRTALVLDARDVSAWAERRRVHVRHDFVGYDAAQAWARVWGDALRGAWPEGLRLRVSDACADVTRTIEPFPYLPAARPLAEIAEGAVDWTAIAGTLLVGGTCTNVLLDVTLTDDAFSGSPEVAKDGLAYASWVGVNGESDVVADAGDPAGLVELVVDDQGARDVRTARVHANQEWAVRGRDGVPRIVSMASDVALSPRAPVGINDLVPGRMVRLAVRPACTEVAQLMRLVALTVTGDAHGEKIVPSFEPLGAVGGRNV